MAGSRSMAKTLGVSRNTVDNAYSQLLMEGYIVPMRGIGYTVLEVPALPKSFRSQYTEAPLKPKTYNNNTQHVVYDLTNSSHTSDLFPKRLWRKYTLECLDRLEQEERLSIHLDKQGELYLRRNLRVYLGILKCGTDCPDISGR